MPILPSGLSDSISDDEDIARFLTQSGHYNSIMAKPSAFLPEHDHKETSVSRHGDQPREKLWELGRDAAQNRTLHGAAIFKASIIRGSQLQLVADEPPQRHAAIRGWPWPDDPVLLKAQQKEIAAVIASKATLVML